MSPIRLLKSGINVKPMQDALAQNPQLWDQQTARTAPTGSPHFGLSDIWARFADPDTMREDGSHDSVWYSAANVLPVRDLVYPLMSEFKGMRLGGVLITRIRPGQVCKPHIDTHWHSSFYSKFAIQIESDYESQAFCFDEAELNTRPGDLFWFNNHFKHWVTNDGEKDRVTMIVCIRTEETKNEYRN